MKRISVSRRATLAGLASTVAALRSAQARLLRSGGGIAPESGAIVDPDGTQIDTKNSLGGSVRNNYGVWTFGPVLTPPTSFGPPGPFGNFTYVKLNGKVIAMDNIPQTQAIRIDHGGNVFVLTTGNDRWWFQFVGYQGSSHFVGSPNIGDSSGAPNGVYFTDPLPTRFSPPYTPSPDGTGISAGSGTVTTDDGVWTFGAGSGSYPPVLNGAPIAVLPNGNNITAMTVSHGGRLFVLGTNLHWYAYLNYNWYDVGISIPPGPIPVEVTLSTNLNNDIVGSSPLGTVIAHIAVTMSDGSPFSGTYGFSSEDALGFVGVSGSNVVVTAPPPVGSAVSGMVSATQNGAAVSAGASTVVIRVLSAASTRFLSNDAGSVMLTDDAGTHYLVPQ